jgi:hypothetical protein
MKITMGEVVGSTQVWVLFKAAITGFLMDWGQGTWNLVKSRLLS